MIKGKESIQEPDNSSKKAKLDSIIDGKTYNLKQTSPPFKNKLKFIILICIHTYTQNKPIDSEQRTKKEI